MVLDQSMVCVLVIMAVFGWYQLDVADTIDVIVKATGSFMLLNSFYQRSARLANVVVITVFAGYLVDSVAGFLLVLSNVIKVGGEEKDVVMS